MSYNSISSATFPTPLFHTTAIMPQTHISTDRSDQNERRSQYLNDTQDKRTNSKTSPEKTPPRHLAQGQETAKTTDTTTPWSPPEGQTIAWPPPYVTYGRQDRCVIPEHMKNKESNTRPAPLIGSPSQRHGEAFEVPETRTGEREKREERAMSSEEDLERRVKTLERCLAEMEKRLARLEKSAR